MILIKSPHSLFICFLCIFSFSTESTFASLACRDFLHLAKQEKVEKADGPLIVYSEPFRFKYGSPYDLPFNKSQKKFLESLGLVFKGREVSWPLQHHLVESLNKRLESLEKEGFDKADIIYPGQAFVLNGSLVFRRFGFLPPLYAKFFDPQGFQVVKDESGKSIYVPKRAQGDEKEASSLLSHHDFHIALAQGYMPLMDAGETFSLGAGTPDSLRHQKESDILHDLAHYGGFFEEPRFMALLMDILIEGPSSQAIERFTLVNEYALLAADPTNKKRRPGLRDLVLDEALPSKVENPSELRHILAKLTKQDLQELAEDVFFLYPDFRRPLGGTVRTAGFSYATSLKPDADFIRLQEAYIKVFGSEEGVSSIKDKWLKYKELKNFREALKNFLWSFQLLSQVTLEDYRIYVEKEESDSSLGAKAILELFSDL